MIGAVKSSNTQQTNSIAVGSGGEFGLTKGVKEIAEERRRQIEDLGYTREHDRNHQGAELIRAALSYLAAADFGDNPPLPFDWPFDPKSWRPEDRRNNLIRAGALIAAELDRMEN